MNRTARLYALAEELRRAGAQGRTSAQLAARFEISPRTVKCDIGAVQRAPFASDGATALAKVFDVLDGASRQRAAELGARIWVNDDPADPPPRATGGPAAGAPAIEEALCRKVVVVLDYTDARGVPTRRRVEPLMMALTYGHWYRVGWCRERDAVRWFRWDRVRDARPTRETAPERPLSVIGEFPPTAHPVGP